jgi:hypothetical protein
MQTNGPKVIIASCRRCEKEKAASKKPKCYQQIMLYIMAIYEACKRYIEQPINTMDPSIIAPYVDHGSYFVEREVYPDANEFNIRMSHVDSMALIRAVKKKRWQIIRRRLMLLAAIIYALYFAYQLNI